MEPQRLDCGGAVHWKMVESYTPPVANIPQPACWSSVESRAGAAAFSGFFGSGQSSVGSSATGASCGINDGEFHGENVEPHCIAGFGTASGLC